MHACRRNLDLCYILMDNEIYGLTKGQAAPTTPSGDKTKSTYYGNPEPSVDPCELAISMGATWVARGFSGDLKGTVDLLVKGMSHKGFAFLNVMSPCVTWRGDDQFKTLKAKLKQIPEGHDASSRSEAMKYTREKEIMSVGVLYEVQQPSLIQRLEANRELSKKAGPPPTTKDVIRSFYPAF
jgi:2-oxoglutarate ferredoxin oxidoreductase subunit beta